MRLGVRIMVFCNCITVHSIRRGAKRHRRKQKASKQSDDYHDGHNKHADRTAKFTRAIQAGRFGCFCFLCLVKHSRAPPLSVLSFQKNINAEEQKMRSYKLFQLFFIFELPKRRLLHSLYERENRTPLSQERKEVRK